MTKIICERRDCQNWLDGECSKEEITVEERTISEEELAICTTYDMVAAFCQGKFEKFMLYNQLNRVSWRQLYCLSRIGKRLLKPQ